MQGSLKETSISKQETANRNESTEIPTWLSDIVVRFKQSHLTLSVDHLGQLDISNSLKGFLIDIINSADKDKYATHNSQLLQETKRLLPKEIQEIRTVVEVVLNSQNKSSTVQNIQTQVNLPPATASVRKLNFASERELMGDRLDIGYGGLDDPAAREEFKNIMATKTEYSEDQRDANDKELNATSTKESELQQIALDHDKDLYLERRFKMAGKTITFAAKPLQHDHVKSSSAPAQLISSTSVQNSVDDILKSANEAYSSGQAVVKVLNSKTHDERTINAASFFKTARSQYKVLSGNPNLSATDKAKVDRRLNKLLEGKYSNASLEATINSMK